LYSDITNKVLGFELGAPNFSSNAIDDPCPSADKYYENQKNNSLENQQRQRDAEINRLIEELEEVENYNLTHRRKKKHPWTEVIIEHGRNCKCCTPPEIVEENEKIWAQKWKEICKQKRETKKLTTKEKAWQDRWDREYERFKEWQRKWGFNYRE
jgi:hypothetical protein